MRRLLYSKLLEWKRRADRKPLILRGARQVGKTWILNEFGRSEFRAFHYLNFQEKNIFKDLFLNGLSPQKILNQLSLLLDADIDVGSDLLIFDEIQDSEEALTSLKYFREEFPQMALCCAGSYIGLTLTEGSFPVGQVEFLDLYPMTFLEYLMAVDARSADFLANLDSGDSISHPVHQKLWELWKTYLFVGGMPEAVMTYCLHTDDLYDAVTRVRDVQNSLIRGCQSDFAKHAGKENASHINRVFETIPVRLAQAVDGGVGRFRFKGVIPDRSKYTQLAGPIDWLVKSGLSLRVNYVEKPEIPLKAFSKENLFKLYFLDVGLLGCVLDLSAASILNQDYGSYKGFFAENYVAQELAATSSSALYCWRGRQSEIEFLRVINDHVVPIEVKAGVCGRSRSLSAYAKKYSPSMKIKVTARNLDRRSDDYINYPLYMAYEL